MLKNLAIQYKYSGEKNAKLLELHHHNLMEYSNYFTENRYIFWCKIKQKSYCLILPLHKSARFFKLALCGHSKHILFQSYK